MFEDSLVESQGRIRTRSRWFAIGSFLVQTALLLLLVLIPLLHPEALPRQSLERLFVAPPPPPRSAPIPARPAPGRHPAPSLEAQLQAPSRIPARILAGVDQPAPLSSSLIGLGGDGPSGIPSGLDIGSSPPIVTVARPPAPRRPMAVSTGVAEGQLLRPIQPTYPAIAKQARIHGTVVIEATISRQGSIEGLRVVEGPPLLRQAAIDAVAAARYRPFLLNGEPVEVQTSIRVIFSLGG